MVPPQTVPDRLQAFCTHRLFDFCSETLFQSKIFEDQASSNYNRGTQRHHPFAWNRERGSVQVRFAAQTAVDACTYLYHVNSNLWENPCLLFGRVVWRALATDEAVPPTVGNDHAQPWQRR